MCIRDRIQPDRRSIDHFTQVAAGKFSSETPTIPEHDAVSRGRQDNPDYASMVHAVDTSVGRVLRAIDAAGQRDNTVVIFFSDNGGLCTLPRRRSAIGGPTCNLPLRSGKGWLYEGGIREPMLVRVPGVTEAGSECPHPVFSTDFFPTMLELASLPPVPHLHTDGESLVPLLRGAQPDEPRTLYWHYPHYHGSSWTPGAAIRRGDWKLIEFYESDETELYNLADDLTESKNVAEQYPQVRDRLKAELTRWQREMGAKMPVEASAARR